MSASGWCVYVLRCGDGSLYTGISNDVERRLARHRAGTGARYTRGRLPLALVYLEPQQGKSEALRRERALKALSKSEKEALVKAARRKRTRRAAPRPKVRHANPSS
jgi:putative endonuclease